MGDAMIISSRLSHYEELDDFNTCDSTKSRSSTKTIGSQDSLAQHCGKNLFEMSTKTSLYLNQLKHSLKSFFSHF